MTCADHIAGSVRCYGKLSVPLIRRAVALLRNPPGRKGKNMSWSIHKTGTNAQVIEHLRKSTAYRSPSAPHENPNADQHDAVRDAAIEMVKALPPKFNCAMLAAHGHVDMNGSASCEVKFTGLTIDFPVPEPLPAVNEGVAVGAGTPVTAAPATATAALEAGTTEAAPAP